MRESWEITMTNPTKSRAELMALLVDDVRRYRHGLVGRWRAATQRMRGGFLEREPKPKPELLAQAQDDMRLFLGALMGELKSFRKRSDSHLRGRRGKS
jgi:hypothetical protein